MAGIINMRGEVQVAKSEPHALSKGDRVEVLPRAYPAVPRGYPPVGVVDAVETLSADAIPAINYLVIFSKKGVADAAGWFRPDELHRIGASGEKP